MFHMNTLKLKTAKILSYFVIFSLVLSNFSVVVNTENVRAQAEPEASSTCSDVDSDNVCDSADNCPLTANPDQADADGDVVGDACDNCPAVANPDQADSNSNGTGDACELVACAYNTDCVEGEICNAGFCELGPVCGDAVCDANGGESCSSCSADCGVCEVEEEPTDFTIKAAKVVCNTEEDLPNWGERNDGGSNDTISKPSVIDENTAADYVAASQGNCHIQPDWEFQWGVGVSDPGKDFFGYAGSGWQVFDTATDYSTMAEVSLSTDASTIKLREVLPENFMPFSWQEGDGAESDVSAEFYCNNDIYHYDNYDYVNSPSSGETYYCVAFNVASYCGDGVVDQDWEQCDSETGCTEQCQWSEQNECSDLVLAKINVNEYNNEGSGTLNDDVYLGSDTNVLVNNIWFPVYWNGAPYALDPDISAYEDVLGLAVQRLSNSLRIVMHTSLGSSDMEEVDATLEFYNANAKISDDNETMDYSDNSGNNKLENSGAHPDSVNVHDGVADFHLWATTADDGFYVDWGIVEDCVNPEYSAYCGDGEVNQEWEQCDPAQNTKSAVACNDQCQLVEQNECSDLVLARVNVDETKNWGNGDMSNELYLGSDSYMIPQGTWFPLYWNGSYFVDPDIATYEDVPGLAVQRLEDSVRTAMYGTGTGSDKEHVHGNVEFYNATLAGQRSDNSNDTPGNNKLEDSVLDISEVDGVGSYNAGNDEVWEDGGQSKFWLTTTSADDGFYSDWAIVDDCHGIKVCKYDIDKNPLSGWEMTLYSSNLVSNGGFEAPVVVDNSGKWQIYPDDSLTSWIVESGAGLEIQNNADGAPHSGSQLAELASENPSVVSQIINTIPSENYEFGFWYSPRPNRPAGDNTIDAMVQVVSDDTFLFDNTIGETAVGGATTDWSYNQYNFVASEATTKIKFADISNIEGSNISHGGYLDDVSVRQVAVGITGEDGCVTFYDLPYGSYEIHETGQEGWTQVEPADPDYFVVDFNEENYNPTVTFVNQREQVETYSVHGYKWEDEDGDGERGEESLLSGWTINLYEGESSEPLMTMDTSNLEDHFGWYWFEGLAAGDYRICEVLKNGWSQTYPEGCHFVTLPTEQITTVNAVEAPEYNFGNQQDPTQEPICGNENLEEGEQCDDGNTDDGDGCSAQCDIEQSIGPAGGGGGLLLGSGTFFNPTTPSTPGQVLGTKLVDDTDNGDTTPTNDDPGTKVLGLKVLPETGANANVFYVSLYLGLMSLLYALFVQTKNTEKN